MDDNFRRMRRPILLFLFLGISAGLSGCGGDASSDPRCQSLCTIKEPSLSGAYDICSQTSADACLKDCGARISEVSTVCASCLLENACFSNGCRDSLGSDPGCTSGQCTISGRVGSCTYPQGDQAAYDNCVRMVYPRREVQCSPEYQSVSKCASVCAQP